MIKRIVFDLDNTLIIWKDKYLDILRKLLFQYGIDDTDYNVAIYNKYIENYENVYDIYDKQLFVDYINVNCNSNFPVEFVDDLIDGQGCCFELDSQLVDVIKYLSGKYDLVVLSNWFSKTQKERLRGIGILDYFTFVSGGDERTFKPSRLAFEFATSGYKPSECLMIGDSLDMDIIPALEYGMDAIWVTESNSGKYKTIENVYELKKIL